MTDDKTHIEHDRKKKNETIKNETIKFELSKTRIWQGLAVVLAIAVVFLWFNQGGGVAGGAQVPVPTAQPSPSPTPQQPQRLDIDLDDDPVLGDEDAPVTIVSFEDYQCPFCRRSYTQMLPQLQKEYIDTGKVKFVYRDFPLSFHPAAQPAAEAANCAGDEEKYWEMHDKIFDEQNKLGQGTVQFTSNDLKQWAADLGLNTGQFNECLDSGKYSREVQNDFAYGTQVGVSGTPTYFINGIKLVGAQPYQAFQQIIEAELANQQKENI